MLLTGTPGSGRSRLAVEIAALANDIAPEETVRHPDIHKLEPGSKSRRILVEPFHQFCEPFFSTSFRAGATKTGIILEGTHARAFAGKAPKEFGDLLHATTVGLFEKAGRIMQAN